MTQKISRDSTILNFYLNKKSLEIKYLGIYFDNRFSLDRHVEYLTGKITPIINMSAGSAELKWSLEHRALKVTYNGAIEPLLTYRAPVWEKALTNKKKTVEIATSENNDEFQNSEGIQNTVT